jgi:hypothetical protein
MNNKEEIINILDLIHSGKLELAYRLFVGIFGLDKHVFTKEEIHEYIRHKYTNDFDNAKISILYNNIAFTDPNEFIKIKFKSKPYKVLPYYIYDETSFHSVRLDVNLSTGSKQPFNIRYNINFDNLTFDLISIYRNYDKADFNLFFEITKRYGRINEKNVRNIEDITTFIRFYKFISSLRQIAYLSETSHIIRSVAEELVKQNKQIKIKVPAGTYHIESYDSTKETCKCKFVNNYDEPKQYKNRALKHILSQINFYT